MHLVPGLGLGHCLSFSVLVVLQLIVDYFYAEFSIT